MRLAIGLLLAGVAWGADPTISGLDIHSKSWSWASVKWTSSPATNRQVAWDTKAYWDANHAYRYSTPKFNSYSTSQYVAVTGLTASTTYVACPLACDASANCIACDALSDPQVEFTTEAQPATATPTLPDLSDFDTTYPTTIGATLNVAGDCSDLQTKITAAAGATYSGQNVEVVIPAGTTCQLTAGNYYVLPPKTGDGYVIIKSGGTLPAEGTRISPDDAAQMAKLVNPNVSLAGIFDFTGGGGTAHHYRLVGLEMTHVARADENDVSFTAQWGIIRADANIHHVILDRCWVHGVGYPDRTFVGWFGAYHDYVAFKDSYFNGFQIWRAYQDGIGVTHTSTSLNTYTGGTVYFGNASASVSAFTVQLGGTGSGTFRLYVERDGSVKFVHNIATLSPTCTGCTASYNASPTVPDDAFSLISADGSWTEGTVTNATFLTSGAATTGNPWGIQDGSSTGLGWEGGYAIYLEGAYTKLLVQNNYIEAVGMALYSEPYAENAPATDIILRQNTFTSDSTLFVHEPGDKNRLGVRRQHVEFKNGQRILIEGNTFTDAWASVNGVPSPAVYLASGMDTTLTASWISDVTISNNLIYNHPSCFFISGASTSGPQLAILSRLLIDNNVCESDAYTWSQFGFWDEYPWNGAMRGQQIEAVMGGEDYTIRHNTFYLGLGFQPSMIRLSDAFYGGLTVQDNIFFLQQSAGGASWGKGLHSRLVYADADGLPAYGSQKYGTSALNTAAILVPSTQSWTFDHNIVVTGCTSAASCESAETSLLTVATEEAAYPSGNFWPAGSTFGARITAVGWTTPGAGAKSDYSLTAKSAYKGLGTAASDPGVNWTELQAALTGEETEPLPEESSLFFSGSITITGSVTLIP